MTDQIEIKVIPAPLIVEIKGGNQMNPFSKSLNIYGDAFDPGVKGYEASR